MFQATTKLRDFIHNLLWGGLQSSRSTFYLKSPPGLQVQIFTGPPSILQARITLLTINSNHQNSKHDDVPNIMWTCQLCIR